MSKKNTPQGPLNVINVKKQGILLVNARIPNIREQKTVNIGDDDEQVNQEEIYNINFFRLSTFSKNNDTDDLKAEVIINNSLDKVILDTGTNLSVCEIHFAKK